MIKHQGQIRMINPLIKRLIIVGILVSAMGLFFPILRNDDPTLYATIAKHIVLSGDWINLTYPGNNDWLDKPHLPFWISAFSFKLFGISSFSYILPGFIFNLVGAYYTYKLGTYLFNKSTGLLSALLHINTLHLIISATVDLRAEAYLVGMITPACYYWLRYFNSSGIRWGDILFGAVFAAFATMSKGLFVLITIFSGIFIVYLYNQLFPKEEKLISIKTNHLLLKSVLCLLSVTLFVLPELAALYLQFDLHPEKVIYGHTGVSGIRWFLLDSQFGRFFNSGPITKTDSSRIWHYFFYVHTFMWAFLPWSVIYVTSIWYHSKNRLAKQDKKIFLFGSFFVTFILFSITRFQLNYYTNVIMPFACIISANWLYHIMVVNSEKNHPILRFQIYFAILVYIISSIVSFDVLKGIPFMIMLTITILMVPVFIAFFYYDYCLKAIVYSVFAINHLFILMLLIYGCTSDYDVGYKAANYLNKLQNNNTVVDFNVNSLTLEFYLKNRYIRESNLLKLNEISKPFYIFARHSSCDSLISLLGSHHVSIIKLLSGTTIDNTVKGILKKDLIESDLTNYSLLKVN